MPASLLASTIPWRQTFSSCALAGAIASPTTKAAIASSRRCPFTFFRMTKSPSMLNLSSILASKFVSQPRSNRKGRGVFGFEPGHLKPQRQFLFMQHWQRNRRHAEQRERHGKYWIAGRAEADWRSARSGQSDTGVALRRELGIKAADANALHKRRTIIVGAHCFRLCEAVEHSAA